MKGPGCCQNIFIMLFLLWKRPGLLTDRGREVGGKAGARESGRHEESELQDLWVGGPQVSFAWCLPLLERCVDGQILITTFSPQQNLAVLYSLSLSLLQQRSWRQILPVVFAGVSYFMHHCDSTFRPCLQDTCTTGLRILTKSCYYWSSDPILFLYSEVEKTPVA